MSEIPDFLQGIDPDMVRELDQQMNEELERHAERQMTAVESCRHSYLERLMRKMEAIDSYMASPSPSKKYLLGMADEIARSHFMYYLDRVFDAPPSVNVPIRLAEALSMADGTQAKLNRQEIGADYLYDMDELRTRIAEILLDDDPQKAKQGIADMYDHTIRGIVLRFISS